MKYSLDTQQARYQLATQKLAQIDKTPYPHQERGIQWMLNLEAHGSGGLLADDPGLGKTLQSLSMVASSPPAMSTLVVVPTSILGQWRVVAEELLGKYAVYVHHGKRDRQAFPMKRLVVTTYGVLRTEIDTLSKIRWGRIILDEIHEIKNRRSKISKAAMRLQSPLRWGLSGTPIQNTREEAANLFRFVLGLGSDNRDTIDVPLMIREKLLRRRKEVVLGEQIPELQVETLTVPFASEKEKKFYAKIQTNVKSDFARIQEQGLEANQENVVLFELLLRLRQVSQHPQIVLNGLWRKFKTDPGSVFFQKKEPTQWGNTPSSKHLEILQQLNHHPEEAAIVFCQFTEEMDILQEFLATNGHHCLRLDGKMNNKEREELLQRCNFNLTQKYFRSDGGLTLPSRAMNHIDDYLRPPHTLIQIKAGGVGLNLQVFSRVYINSPDWNPCNEIQAMARSHRIGQTRKVVAKRIILESPEDGPIVI